MLRPVLALGRKTWLATGVAAATLAFAAPAGAQVSQVDELVVTARKVEERLQDVPIAVSAFTGESLERKQAQNLIDVAEFTPGVQIQQGFGRDGDRPVFRGTSNILTSDAKVGIFVDGIPYFGDFSTLDLETAQRVEVIKGPQSAVFGRGTLSGAINVVTRRPSEEFAGRMRASAGNYGRRELSGMASGPLFAPWIKGQLGFKAFNTEGQFKNLAVEGETLGAQRTRVLTGGLFFDPMEGLDASVRFIKQEDRDGHFAVQLQPSTRNNCFLNTRGYFCGEVQAPTSYFINTNRIRNAGLERDAERVIYDLNWDVGKSGYLFTYQGGINEVYESTGYDQSYDNRDFFLIGAGCPFARIPNSVCGVSPFNDTNSSRRNTTTHEARLSSPADQRLRGRIGAYRSLDRSKPLTEYLELTETGPDALGAATRIENTAFFGGVDFDILENLTLTLEARRATDKVRSTTLSYQVRQYFDPSRLALLPVSNPNAISGVPALRNATFKATLPRVTLTWKPQADITVYGQYAEGNSAGGFNDPAAPITTFDEEKLKNYELGVKTQLLGFDYLNASVYFNEYLGQVLTNTFAGPTAVQSFRANAGDSEIKGFELEGSRELLMPGLQFNFAYSYIDAEFTRGADPDQAVLLLGAACKTGAAADLSRPGCRAAGSLVGKRPPLVSRHLASLGLNYRGDTQWTGVGWFAGGDLTHRSKMFDQVHNLLELGATTKLNLQAGIETEGGLRLAVWGKNVNDDDTPQGSLRFVDFPGPISPTGDRPRAFAITPSPKPTYGVTLTKDF